MIKRGRGIGCNLYGVGYGFNRADHSAAMIEVADDGSMTVLTGACDIGQGSDTALCQIAAQEMGISYDDVRIVSADTLYTPDALCTSASRQTFVTGEAIRLAVADAKMYLLKLAAELLESPEEDLDIQDGIVFSKSNPESIQMPFATLAWEAHFRGKRFMGFAWYDNTTPDVEKGTSQGDAYATYIYATQVADVEVDTETGDVTVVRVGAAHDVGRAIHPQNIEQQIEGAVAQGMGYAIMEEIVMKEGKTLTPSFAKFLIPTSKDVPEVNSYIVESYDPKGPFGAKGVGEGAIIPTAVAIANAVYDAVGIRIYDLPITPEKVLAALAEKQNAQ